MSVETIDERIVIISAPRIVGHQPELDIPRLRCYAVQITATITATLMTNVAIPRVTMRTGSASTFRIGRTNALAKANNATMIRNPNQSPPKVRPSMTAKVSQTIAAFSATRRRKCMD